LLANCHVSAAESIRTHEMLAGEIVEPSGDGVPAAGQPLETAPPSGRALGDPTPANTRNAISARSVLIA
jgi:hypothetical protein